jgi:plastocyanin
LKSPQTLNNICISLIIPLISLAGCSSEPDKIVPELHTIVISEMRFNPAELTINKGDTVVFVNKDLVVHDITEVPDKTWTSSNLSPGQSYKMAVRTSADYFCSIHPVMKGKIVVQ